MPFSGSELDCQALWKGLPGPPEAKAAASPVVILAGDVTVLPLPSKIPSHFVVHQVLLFLSLALFYLKVHCCFSASWEGGSIFGPPVTCSWKVAVSCGEFEPEDSVWCFTMCFGLLW